MTQATESGEVLRQLEKLSAMAQRIDANVGELWLEVKTFQARADEHFKSIDQRLERLEKRTDAQDTRLGGLLLLSS